MREFPARGNDAGFTLLEVLIAISIFAVVVSAVYGAYRTTFDTIASSERQVATASAARVILERMSADLESISTAEDGYLRGKRGEVDGRRADILSCVSLAHVVFSRKAPPVKRAALSYTITETESGLFDLYRADVPMTPQTNGATGDTAQAEILGKGLLELRITYVTADGQEVDEWDSAVTGTTAGNVTMKLPVMIRLQISFGDAEKGETDAIFRTAVALPVVPVVAGEG